MPGGQHPHRIADRHPATGQLAGIPTEIGIGPVHPLHRQPQRRGGGIIAGMGGAGFQPFDQRRPAEPVHAGGGQGDIVAIQAGYRDGGGIQPQRGGKGGEIGGNAAEAGFIMVHQVHLVHRQHHMADAQQRGDGGVAARLGQQPGAGIHQHDGGIRRAGAGDHVAGVMLMAGAICQNEARGGRGEKAIGDIDGDALFAFGGQPIHQQGKIQRLALRADAPAVCRQRIQLVGHHRLGIKQQPANQRGFAIIHTATGDDAQQRHFCHQKYPSCFFNSMLAVGSWSTARPIRSETVAARISAMMAGRVAAWLSMAPDSG